MDIQTDLFAQKVTVTAQKIKDLFNEVQINKQWGLLELYKHTNLELKKLIDVTIAKNTYDKHEYVLNYLTAYLKNIDKPVGDIKASFINEFNAYLRHDIKQKNNTAVSYMKRVKMIFK